MLRKKKFKEFFIYKINLGTKTVIKTKIQKLYELMTFFFFKMLIAKKIGVVVECVFATPFVFREEDKNMFSII